MEKLDLLPDTMYWVKSIRVNEGGQDEYSFCVFLQTDKQSVRSSTSPTPTPILAESQINAIAQAAARLAKELPPFDMKKLNMKKPINKEIMVCPHVG